MGLEHLDLRGSVRALGVTTGDDHTLLAEQRVRLGPPLLRDQGARQDVVEGRTIILDLAELVERGERREQAREGLGLGFPARSGSGRASCL